MKLAGKRNSTIDALGGMSQERPSILEEDSIFSKNPHIPSIKFNNLDKTEVSGENFLKNRKGSVAVDSLENGVSSQVVHQRTGNVKIQGDQIGNATFSEPADSMLDDVSETIEVGSYKNADVDETISDLQK